jgi:hypothetical protein
MTKDETEPMDTPRSPSTASPAADEFGPESRRDDDVQRLVKSAFDDSDELSNVDVLGGVQQRLRERSRGKFYRDGWSTVRHPPFATYFITSLMMLAIMAIIYAILTPLVGAPVRVNPEPAPIQILPPR